MKGIDTHNDLVPLPPNPNWDSVFHDVLDLSTIDPPNNRMQRTLEIIEIEDQNLYSPQSNVDCINLGGISRPSVLHQVRDQTSPGQKLISGCNTFRDNDGRNYCSEVNNLNLSGFNLTQNYMNPAIVRDSNYQPMYNNDKVLNPHRVGLDLNTQEDQGEFNSHPMISKLGTRPRAEAVYCSDKVLNPYGVGFDLDTQEGQREFNSCPMILVLGLELNLLMLFINLCIVVIRSLIHTELNWI